MSTKRLLGLLVAVCAPLNVLTVALVVAFRPTDEEAYAVLSALLVAAVGVLALVMLVIRLRGGHPLDRISRGPRRHPW